MLEIGADKSNAGDLIKDVNEKFSQKLSYLTCMEKYFNNLDLKRSILVGDLNIAPRPDDVWDHKKLSKVVSHTPIEIKHLKKVQDSGPWDDCEAGYS